VRVIGGRWKGTRLAEVGKGDAAAHLRPTSDRVREALFNLLLNGGYGDPVTGARVLDLFAGTGALGFEALSRGAEAVTFLDTGAKALTLLRANADKLRAGDAAAILRRDATRPGAWDGAGHTLVFLDPPYGKGLGERALKAASAGNWMTPEALIVLEENAEMTAPEGFALLDHRRYGDTHIHILRAP
jgi:16S rRNA (guanine966-N2)-methyltransferase